MALLSIKRDVDIVPGVSAPVVFHVSQNDVGTNVILSLLNYGTAYNVPQDTTVTIIGSASNGNVFNPVNATYSGSDVTFRLSEEMSSVAGPALCEAVLVLDDNVLGTANFIINVEASPMGADVPPVFTDAAWDWMLGKFNSEIIPEFNASLIDAIDSKLDKVFPTDLSGKYLKINSTGHVEPSDIEEIPVDATLSHEGEAADAKATGDALALKANESTIAPEFSASASYTAGQYVYKNGALYKFTADHSGAWTGTDAVEVTVSKKLTDLKADNSELKRALINSQIDILPFYHLEKQPLPSRGIAVTQLSHDTFHFEGTIEGSSFYGFYNNLNVLPDLLIPGETYTMTVSGATENSKIYFEVRGFRNGTTEVSLSGMRYNDGEFYFTIPSDWVGGAIVRAGWLRVNAGTAVNETIEYHIYHGYNSGVQTAYKAQYGIHNIGDHYTYQSCDDIPSGTILFVSSGGGVKTIPDAPFIGFIETVGVNSDIAYQIAYPYHATDHIMYRQKNNSGWISWKDVGSGSSTVTITQEVSRDTYNNTYNINTSPTITTDSNGWLQPVDTNTEDETNKTDMSGAIISMLNSTGYCHLAPGIYYVSGNIDMPADSMLEGCGKQTIIRLLQSTTSGYIVRMHTRSTVKNVCFSGSYSTGSISDGNIGGRRGINYIGNRDGQNTGITPSTCTCCMIDGCYFENLDSGIYGYNAGGGLQEGLICNNCYFTRCKAGINLDYWVEYSKFTNCITFQCYYGCINNGGSNTFTACTFHGVIGFLIDNSSGSKSNAAHGTVNGCTFNHIDNMNNPSELGKGIGIKVLNVPYGFIFTNCQLWYGRVHIESSTGIQITGCEFGGLGGASYPAIETSGNGMVFVNNCLFQTTPTLAMSSPSKITNCWTYNGVAVTA